MTQSSTILLGVNIDHIATLRQARLTRYPDPVYAALEAEAGGADGITLHLREDKRHIQDRDVELIKQVLLTRMNLEMAATKAMVAFAKKIKPEHCCLVPEKREELTTEGGLDVKSNVHLYREICHELTDAGIEVSFFIDPDQGQIEAAKSCDAKVIEIHTGAYADAHSQGTKQKEFDRIKDAVCFASKLDLVVNAGHGLNYQNVEAIAQLPQINELNIGHGIIAEACFIGLRQAVQKMKQLIRGARL